MFRTIKLKLPYDLSLLETGKQFREACQVVLDYGFSEKTFNKNKLNRETYKDVREKIPTLPSELVQTANDTASEALKQTKFEGGIHRKSCTIRYDRRTFEFYPDSRMVSLTTIKGRLLFPVANSPLIEKHRGKYTNAQVVINTKEMKMSIMIQVEIDREASKKIANKGDVKVVRIDRNNRNGSNFHCKNCNFQLHADLNASRNIGILGKSEYFRLLSTSQSLRFNESMPTGMEETSSKPTPEGVGSRH